MAVADAYCHTPIVRRSLPSMITEESDAGCQYVADVAVAMSVAVTITALFIVAVDSWSHLIKKSMIAKAHNI